MRPTQEQRRANWKYLRNMPIGTRVKRNASYFSFSSKAMEARFGHLRKIEGTITGVSAFDGCLMVWWDNRKRPESMHTHFLEAIPTTPITKS